MDAFFHYFLRFICMMKIHGINVRLHGYLQLHAIRNIYKENPKYESLVLCIEKQSSMCLPDKKKL